ncbi:hypothetical protein HK099_002765, partial [Clydaea vesicula]
MKANSDSCHFDANDLCERPFYYSQSIFQLSEIHLLDRVIHASFNYSKQQNSLARRFFSSLYSSKAWQAKIMYINSLNQKYMDWEYSIAQTEANSQPDPSWSSQNSSCNSPIISSNSSDTTQVLKSPIEESLDSSLIDLPPTPNNCSSLTNNLFLNTIAEPTVGSLINALDNSDLNYGFSCSNQPESSNNENVTCTKNSNSKSDCDCKFESSDTSSTFTVDGNYNIKVTPATVPSNSVSVPDTNVISFLSTDNYIQPLQRMQHHIPKLIIYPPPLKYSPKANFYLPFRQSQLKKYSFTREEMEEDLEIEDMVKEELLDVSEDSDDLSSCDDITPPIFNYQQIENSTFEELNPNNNKIFDIKTNISNISCKKKLINALVTEEKIDQEKHKQKINIGKSRKRKSEEFEIDNEI